MYRYFHRSFIRLQEACNGYDWFSLPVLEDLNWDFGGCSDSLLDFGRNVSKIFLDHQETARDLRAAVALHNYEAGRKVLIHYMVWWLFG